MQGIIAALIMIISFTGAASESTPESFGTMPEIVVTAPRYEYEDMAWSGLMPEIVVSAKRPQPILNEPGSQGKQISRTKTDVNGVSRRKNELLSVLKEHTPTPGFAFAQPVKIRKEINLLEGSRNIDGDYHVPETDTIDDDVTITGGNARVDGVIDGDLAVMGGMVEVKGMVVGDAAVMGGNLDILGTIQGDAAVFGGNIVHKGIIEGDLLVVGGTAALDSGAVVEGDIQTIGGTVNVNDNASVLGEIESIESEALREIIPRVGKIFRWPHLVPAHDVFPKIIFILALLVTFIMDLLVVVIFPAAVDRIIEKLQRNIWISVAAGVGTEILYVPILILFAVSIIGIPLIPVFVLAVFLSIIFGFTAFSLLVGERAVKGFGWKVSSRVGTFSLGWLAIMIIPIIAFLIGPPISVLGFIIIYVTVTIGLGGTVYALIKRKQGSVKK